MTIEEISSPSNQRIKAAIALRDPRERRATGLMLLDGQAIAEHALAGGVEFVELFIASLPNESHRVAVSHWQAHAPLARMNVVSAAAMSKLQYGERHVEFVAIARQPSLALETLEERAQTLSERTAERSHAVYVVLDQMEKPGNLGAVIRSADAAGVRAVLLSDPISETWNPNAIRSSLGAIFRIPLAVGSAKQIQSWLSERGIQMFSARVNADNSYTEISYPDQVAIIVGNESVGLGENWKIPSNEVVTIPMFGAVDSLNVSVSASIILFEVLRQHRREVR